MWKTLLARRMLLAVPTLFGVAVVVFVLVRLVPGNPIAMMLPPGASEQDIRNLEAFYGLDKSISEQFVIWLTRTLTGDFGLSISLRQNVGLLVLSRLPATVELVFSAMLIAVIAGIGIACLGTYYQESWQNSLIDSINGILLAIPDFIWGLMLILIFGVLLPILPISGRFDPRLDLDFATKFYLTEALVSGRWSVFGHLVLHILIPALALALPLMAIIVRVLKASLKEVMVSDYILLARIKGFSRRRIILQEALRNAMVPTLALTGVQFTFLVGGTVLIERLFSWPGIGNMALDAVINRDLPLIQGVVLAFAVIFILVNIAVDLAVMFLNPRLRRG